MPTFSAFAAENSCFYARKNDSRVVIQAGDCGTRHSPWSSFKPVIALMGFDHGVLQSPTSPEVKFQKKYLDLCDISEAIVKMHSIDCTPAKWIKFSVIWYSQYVTQKLGMKTFKNYVETFNYGNMDVSGDQGKVNGLTHCWIMSSLQISAKEQVAFLETLLSSEAPATLKVSEAAIQHTKDVMLLNDPLPGGWTLYGKTGGSQKQGWFVGWVEKEGNHITFARYIEKDNSESYLGPAAKVEVIEALKKKWLLTENF